MSLLKMDSDDIGQYSLQDLNGCLIWEQVRHVRLSIHPVIHQV